MDGGGRGESGERSLVGFYCRNHRVTLNVREVGNEAGCR